MKMLSLLMFMVISFTYVDAQVKPTRDEAEQWLLNKLDRYIDHVFSPALDIRIDRGSNTLIFKNRDITDEGGTVFVTHIVKIDEITYVDCEGQAIDIHTQPNGVTTSYTTWSNVVKNFYTIKEERRKNVFYSFVRGANEPNLTERVRKCIQDLQSKKKESY